MTLQERLATKASRLVEPGGKKSRKSPDLAAIRQQVEDWEKVPMREQIRRNCERADELCVQWEDARDRTGPGAKVGRHSLVFMHIPKAGGSTLDNIIPPNYPINGVIHINHPSLVRNPAALFKDHRGFPKAVMGHYKFGSVVYQFADGPFVHITMLREPVSRLISYYNYLLTSTTHGGNRRVRDVTFEQYVESLRNVECHNGQSSRVSGLMGRRFLKKADLRSEMLDLARENLERRFTFFGLTEQYGEFLLTCRRILGWEDLYYSSKKVTPKSHPNRVIRSELSDSVLERVRELNAVDIELYAWAKKTVEARNAELDITPQRVEEFNRRNTVHAELLSEPFWNDGKSS